MDSDNEIRKLCEEFDQMLAICADSMPVETTAGNLRAWLRSKLEGERWIAVTERLPEEGEQVDVWSKEYGRLANMAITLLAEDEWFFDPTDSGPCVVRDVTHWRPLPSSPEVMG